MDKVHRVPYLTAHNWDKSPRRVGVKRFRLGGAPVAAGRQRLVGRCQRTSRILEARRMLGPHVASRGGRRDRGSEIAATQAFLHRSLRQVMAGQHHLRRYRPRRSVGGDHARHRGSAGLAERPLAQIRPPDTWTPSWRGGSGPQGSAPAAVARAACSPPPSTKPPRLLLRPREGLGGRVPKRLCLDAASCCYSGQNCGLGLSLSVAANTLAIPAIRLDAGAAADAVSSQSPWLAGHSLSIVHRGFRAIGSYHVSHRRHRRPAPDFCESHNGVP